jgi:excisionase family DNA binding protein
MENKKEQETKKSSEVKISSSSIKSEQLLSMKDVSVYLNISYDTVKEMVAARKLPYVVIGARKRFIKRHLDSWIESRIVPAKK